MNNKDIDVYVQGKYIGMRLESIRKSRHISQKQMVELSGLNQGTICHIEHGYGCNLDSLIKYINAIGYDIDFTKKVDGDDNDSEGSNKTISYTST